MKIVSVVAKVLAALAAAVGAIYLLATYGEQIVAWCKKTLAAMPKCPDAEPEVVEDFEEEAAEEALRDSADYAGIAGIADD